MPIACQALEHKSREIRLVGLRLANLVSTTSGSRQTAIRYGLLDHVKVGDFDDDEGEGEKAKQRTACNVAGIRVLPCKVAESIRENWADSSGILQRIPKITSRGEITP